MHPAFGSHVSRVHASPSSQLPHAAQAEAPDVAANVPSGHAWQALSPPVKVPGSQAPHEVAPAAENLPASHGVHVLEPAAAENVPAGHVVQEVAPSAVEAVPGAHEAHVASAFAVHAVVCEVPAAQTVHALQAPLSTK